MIWVLITKKKKNNFNVNRLPFICSCQNLKKIIEIRDHVK